MTHGNGIKPEWCNWYILVIRDYLNQNLGGRVVDRTLSLFQKSFSSTEVKSCFVTLVREKVAHADIKTQNCLKTMKNYAVERVASS